jgi:hypothetical protein
MSKSTVAFLCVVCLVVGAAAGVYFIAPALTQHHYTERVVEKPIEVKVPVVVEGQSTHTVSYVDRPILINAANGQPITDPQTGQPIQDQADIVASHGTKSSITIGMIGPSGQRKDIKFDKAFGERWIFDTHQVRMENDINLTATLDATDMFNAYASLQEDKAREEARKQYLKHFGISVGYMPGAGKHAGLGWSPNGITEYEIKKPLDHDGIGGEIRLRF